MTPIRIFISSVQVMLFADRLEVMNSGGLPPGLTVEKLRVAHQSVPRNPLLAESMYLMRYIEKMGTGTLDMIRRCAKAGLAEPEFEVGAGFVKRIWRSGETTQEGSGTTPITTAIADSTTAKTTGKTTGKRILALLRSDPEISLPAVAERVGSVREAGATALRSFAPAR